MAVTSNRSLTVQLTDDVEYTQEFNAAPNATSPGVISLVDLVLGNNTITVPTGAVAVTVIPPEDNENTLTLKGVNGDTGIALSLVDPFSLSLSSVANFVLEAGDTIEGVRLIFT